ncbi:MAG: extracellular solute-binding protein [Clostridiales bacterium]|nr:extracellular solute-binding protein [Clostridiales bacterium]
MKKLLATLLASTMAFSVMGGLAACGGDDSGPELKVWAPGESIATYRELAKQFQKEHSEYSKYNIKFEPVEEGSVQTQMGKDPSTGAAVFFFPSDHLYRLNKAKVLQPLTSEYVEIVKERDDQQVYEFVTIENQMLAFPATNDNGLFLLYDSDALTEDEVKSLDTMQKKAKAAGKSIAFDYGDVYTSISFFIGAGCEFGYKDHTMTEYHTTLGSEKGEVATKAYLKYFNPELNNDYKAENKVINNGALAVGLANGNYVAGVTGTWTWASIKSQMEAKGKDPSKIKSAVLPDFEVDGQPYHMGSFYGAKYCGVNRQKDRDTIKASLALASYFTSEEGQLARYQATFSGPSNIKAAQDPTIAADPRLITYNEQKTHCGYPQRDQSGDFWSGSGFGNLANKIATGSIRDSKNPDHTGKTDEQIAIALLKELAGSLEKGAKV